MFFVAIFSTWILRVGSCSKRQNHRGRRERQRTQKKDTDKRGFSFSVPSRFFLCGLCGLSIPRMQMHYPGNELVNLWAIRHKERKRRKDCQIGHLAVQRFEG